MLPEAVGHITSDPDGKSELVKRLHSGTDRNIVEHLLQDSSRCRGLLKADVVASTFYQVELSVGRFSRHCGSGNGCGCCVLLTANDYERPLPGSDELGPVANHCGTSAHRG